MFATEKQSICGCIIKGQGGKVKNNANALFFTHKVCVEAPQTLRSHRRNRLREFLLACLSAKRFDMEVRVKNHSDELIFHSQGLRRSAANLEIASENSPSRRKHRIRVRRIRLRQRSRTGQNRPKRSLLQRNPQRKSLLRNPPRSPQRKSLLKRRLKSRPQK